MQDYWDMGVINHLIINDDRYKYKIIESFKDKLDWDYLTPRLSIDDFVTYKEYVSWDIISLISHTTPSFLKSMAKYLSWDTVSLHHVLTDEFIELCDDYIIWNVLSQRWDLFSDFLMKYSDRLNISLLCVALNDELIEIYKDQLDWHRIFHHLTVTQCKKYKTYLQRMWPC